MHPTSLTKVHTLKRLLIPALVGLMPFQPILQAASSLPTGGTFTAGAGKISAAGNLMTITQSSLKGIIDWSTFSIGRGSTVSVRNGSGATLNLVTGGAPSTLLGQLLATGNLYLLNPEGVLIGKGATVRTGGDFVASTLTMPAAQFLSNAPLLFSGSSEATVVNLGSISSSGGNIYLIGRSVQSGGSISSPSGTAGLAAGGQVLISDSANGQKVAVQAPGGDVTNTGFINAAQVELKSNGGNIYALAGSNGGYINATGAANIDGHVWLIATNGTTNVSGEITAANANGTGGAIETSGAQVVTNNAQIKTGKGGNWLLDPDDLTIDSTLAATIDSTLNGGTNVTEQTGNGNSGNGDLTVASPIAWTTGAGLTLSAFRNVVLNAGISNTGSGNLTVRADNTSTGTGTISGAGVMNWSASTGNVALLYNPSSYASPTSYSANLGSANGAWAAPASGSVSSQYTAYMLVNSESNLQNINGNLNGTYALGNDLDLSTTSNFAPLDPGNTYFAGIFDGMGHTISNVTISAGTTVGFFGVIGPGGQVRNLNLSNLDVTVTSVANSAGGLAGGVDATGTISNSTVSGILHAGSTTNWAGGLVGGLSGTVQNSSSSVLVDAAQGTNMNVGGLVGEMQSSSASVQNSSASGAVNAGQNSLTGGLVGFAFGPVSGSYATGAVTGGADVGGLIGYAIDTVSDSYATGAVAGDVSSYRVGGLTGRSFAAVTGSYATGSITCNACGYTGGLIGQASAAVSSSYATGSISAGNSSKSGGLIGYSTASLSDSYATGNVAGGGYVGGLAGYMSGISATTTDSYATGSLTAGGSTYRMGGLIADSEGTITGSYATGSVTCNNCGYLGGLTGQNFAITNSYATGAVTGGAYTDAGGLTGRNGDPITGCYATGAVTVGTSGVAGGLAGVSYSPIVNSFATGAVSGGDGSEVGGLVGENHDAISVSYAMGNVTGGNSANAGGFVGNQLGSLTDVYSRGAVTAGTSSLVGGLVGYYSGSSIANAYSSGAVSAASGSSVAGLIGQIAAGSVATSYWDDQASGDPSVGVASGGTVGYTPLTTAQLKIGGFSNLLGFNATNTVWTAPAGVYPYFGWQGPLVQVQGNAFNGASALGSAGVGVVWQGSVIANTITQSGGYYSLRVPQNMTIGGVLTYLTSGGLANAFTDGASIQGFGGMELQVGDVYIINGAISTLSSLTNSLGVAMGGFTGSNFLYTASNGLLNLNSGVGLLLASYPSFTFDRPLTTTGNILFETLESATIADASAITAGSGDSIKIAVGVGDPNGAFTNNAGANALNVSGGGTWLVYSHNPANDTTGGLTPAFIQYNAALLSAPGESGDGLLYTIAPVITPSVIGTVSKTYDGTTTAALTPSNFAMSGAINGDTVTITTPTSGTYESANVGASIEVTAPGVAIGSMSHGSIPVYGYQIADGPATGEIGIINPATLTYTANSSSRTYGGGNPSFTGTVTGFVDGQTLATATTGTAAFTAGVTAAGNVGTYAISGSSLTANNGNYTFVQADANSSALTITPATLIYTADPVSRPSGTNNPAFTGSLSGFVNGQTLASATTGTALFTSSANSTGAAGGYAINGSGLTADNGNYVFTQSSSNATALTVTAAVAPTPPPVPTPTPTPAPAPTPAPPTVLPFVIGNATGLQNSNPTFTAAYTGSAIGGLNIGSILSGLAFTITPAISGPGTYTIAATGTAPSGYVLNIAPATLTIVGSSSAILPTQAPLVLPVVPELLPESGGNEATSLLPPINSVGLFQVSVTSNGSNFGASFTGFASQQPLSQSMYFGANDKKDTYSAGAKP